MIYLEGESLRITKDAIVKLKDTLTTLTVVANYYVAP